MEVGDRYRHVKRGTTYTVVEIGELQVATRSPAEGDRVVAYRGEDGQIWLRAEAEFLDGRFERVDLRTSAAGGDWKWFHAKSPEDFCTGPFETRDEAIAAGTAYHDFGHFEAEDNPGIWLNSFYVCEALHEPLRLAEWVGADRALERAEEDIVDSDRVASEYDDGPFFNATPDEETDLRRRIERACDEWQAAHGLVFTCRTFAAMRNAETVTVDVTEARAAARREREHLEDDK